MQRISVDDVIVRNHVNVMEDSSDEIRRGEQALQLTDELNVREPYSVTDPGVRFEGVFGEAVASYEASLVVMGDELLIMARTLLQLADEVTSVDEDLAARLRALADEIDGGAGAGSTAPGTPYLPGPIMRPPVIDPGLGTPMEPTDPAGPTEPPENDGTAMAIGTLPSLRERFELAVCDPPLPDRLDRPQPIAPTAANPSGDQA